MMEVKPCGKEVKGVEGMLVRCGGCMVPDRKLDVRRNWVNMVNILNEWMNEWSIYIALYCALLYTQSALQWYRGSLLNHHQCAASTWMMRRQPQHNGASALTTHQLQVERRERSSQSSGWGLLGGHDWQGPVEGIWSTYWAHAHEALSRLSREHC